MRHWQTAIKYPHSTDRVRWQQHYNSARRSTGILFSSFAISLCCLPLSPPLHPHPSTFLLYLFFFLLPLSNTLCFWKPSKSCLRLFWRSYAQCGTLAWGEWRHGWPQTVIEPIHMRSVTHYLVTSMTPAKETMHVSSVHGCIHSHLKPCSWTS